MGVVYYLSGCTNERSEITDIPEMNIEHHFLDKLKVRIRVAKEIDTLQHRQNKAKHEKKWMRATAEALDIDLGSDYQSEYVPELLYRLFVNWNESVTTALALPNGRIRPMTSNWASSRQSYDNY